MRYSLKPTMKTKAEIEAAFLKDLQDLLDFYDAELEAKDHFEGYPECGEDVRITVSIPAHWTMSGELTREDTEIDLGRHLFPTPKANAY